MSCLNKKLTTAQKSFIYLFILLNLKPILCNELILLLINIPKTYSLPWKKALLLKSKRVEVGIRPLYMFFQNSNCV